MKRFLILFLIVLLSLFIQINLKNYLHWTVDLTLAALITISIFANFLELLFLVLAVALILNWTPFLNLELLLYSAIPVVAFLLKPILPWRSWASNLLLIFFGTGLFYFAAQGSYSFLNAKFLFAMNLVLSCLTGFLIYFLISNVLQYKTRTGRS